MENRFAINCRVVLRAFCVGFLLLMFGASAAESRQVTGTLGSPEATTTVHRARLVRYPPPSEARAQVAEVLWLKPDFQLSKAGFAYKNATDVEHIFKACERRD